MEQEQEIAALLQQGKAAVEDGDYPTARKYLKQVVMRDPHNEQGWLWLSGILDNPERMQYCLERVLQINPKNYHAAAALRDMGINVELPAEPSETKPLALAEEPIELGPAPTVPKREPKHHIRRRPDSMVEGHAVTELTHSHRNTAWAYMLVWSTIWGLHAMLVRSQFAGPRPSLGDIFVGTLIIVVIQALAWLVFLGLLDRSQRLHTLHHTNTYSAISIALWPSGLTALGALLLGIWGFAGSASFVAFSDLLRLVLTVASFMLLLRGLLRELTNNNLHARTARRSIGGAFLGFIMAWGIANAIAWNLVG